MELRSSSGDSCNLEIAAAEMRRLELLAEKESVCRNIDYNQQVKAQLQKQLRSILITQTQDKGSATKKDGHPSPLPCPMSDTRPCQYPTLSVSVSDTDTTPVLHSIF